jgi:hypothetical protein
LTWLHIRDVKSVGQARTLVTLLSQPTRGGGDWLSPLMAAGVDGLLIGLLIWHCIVSNLTRLSLDVLSKRAFDQRSRWPELSCIVLLQSKQTWNQSAPSTTLYLTHAEFSNNVDQTRSPRFTRLGSPDISVKPHEAIQGLYLPDQYFEHFTAPDESVGARPLV